MKKACSLVSLSLAAFAVALLSSSLVNSAKADDSTPVQPAIRSIPATAAVTSKKPANESVLQTDPKLDQMIERAQDRFIVRRTFIDRRFNNAARTIVGRLKLDYSTNSPYSIVIFPYRSQPVAWASWTIPL